MLTTNIISTVELLDLTFHRYEDIKNRLCEAELR